MEKNVANIERWVSLLGGGALAVVMSGSGPSLAALLPWEVQRLAPDVEERVREAAGRPLRYVATEPLGSPAG